MTTNDITRYDTYVEGSICPDDYGDYVTYADHVKAIDKARDDALEDYATGYSQAMNHHKGDHQ